MIRDVAVEDGDWTAWVAEIQEEARADARVGLIEVGMHLRNAIVAKLSGQRTGRRYRVPGTSRTYQASAPGEAPAVLFGQLRNSITASEVEEVDGGLEIEVGVRSAVPYARILEFGGFTGRGKTTYIAQRPYLRNTFEEERGRVTDILRRYMP